MRALLIAAVRYTYIEAIADPTLSFAQTTTLQLLTHPLWTTYSKIHIANMLKILERMQAPIQTMALMPCLLSSSMAASLLPLA